MMYFSQIRAGLISSALLLTTALANPVLAETLPEISPRQIASDVERVQNPQTGEQEFIAPSFDPFEEDPNMAGAVSLRSVANAITLDGRSVRGGAMLDMSFYYNSGSNDPYDTRGYEEVVHLSGEFAPVIVRDNRILECNEQVQDLVYYHEDYYRPSLYGSLYRPFPFYSGHYGFRQGYGFNYGLSRSGFLGYSAFRGLSSSRRVNRSRRGLTSAERRRIRNRRNNFERNGNRAEDRERRANREERWSQTSREDRRGNREERRANREGRRANRNEGTRNRNRAETRLDSRSRLIGGRSRFDTNASVAGRRTLSRNNGVSTSARTAAPVTSAPSVAPQSSAAPRAATSSPRTQRAAPARRERAERSRPARTERSSRPAARTERSRPARTQRSNRSQGTKSRNSPRRSGSRSGNIKRRMMSFMPMASAWSRNVVRNVDIQCAREEILTVHISQERLDAARFDGLTVLVLDRTGQEIPVFVPPNYIEGFRQAVNGRVTPNVSYQEPNRSAPVTRAPVYQDPRSYGTQQAPCPTGTTQQSDGTCLQGGATTYSGYPTR